MKSLLISCLAIASFICSCNVTPACIDCPDTLHLDSVVVVDSVKVDSISK